MLALLAATLLAQQPATANDTGVRVSGRVVSIYPAAVAGVSVDLTRIDGSRVDRSSTTTDEQGRFAFTRVAEGRYELSASKPGYASRTLNADRVHFDSGVSVTVRRGRNVADVEVPIRRTASLAGRVIRSNGAAAPGIHIVLAQRRGRELVSLNDTLTTTTWDGRYTIANVPPGSYLLLASGIATSPATLSQTEQAALEINRTRPEDFTPTLYPGVPSTEGGDAIALLEGVATDGVDLWLAPAQRFSVSGRVVWPEGLAVRGISIEYGNPSDRQARIWTVSDPGGLFTVDGVAAGTVVLLATADSDRGPLRGIALTDVHIGDVEDLTLALMVPGSVEGRVSFSADVPATSRPDTIALVPTLLHVSRLYPASEASIAANGMFTLANALGEYEVALPGLAPGFRVSVSRDGLPIRGSRIGVGAGEAVTGLTVTVSK